MRIILVVVSFVLLLVLLYAVRQAIVLLGLAFFFALALNPPVSFVTERMPRDSRVLGTGVAYLLVISIIGLVLNLIILGVTIWTLYTIGWDAWSDEFIRKWNEGLQNSGR